jgi:hypothetical protein
MPNDLSLLLLTFVPGALVGLGLGIALRHYRPCLCDRYAAWSLTVPWWFFAAGAMFFALMSVYQVNDGWWSFAVVFAAFGVLDLVAMGLAIGRRHSPTGAAQVAEPGAAPDPARDNGPAIS